MVGAWSCAQACYVLTEAFRRRYRVQEGAAVRMTGLLFARPEVRMARDEIVPSLDYFHHRSGNNIDFFCAGYGRYWYGRVPDERAVTPDKPPWLFSLSLFDGFRKEVEELSTWRYSGEADLLLMNALFDEKDGKASLDFESAIVCDLERMKRDGAIESVGRFFEDVFRFAEHALADDPTWGFSDQMGIRSAGAALKRVILSLLPKNLGDDYKRTEHFAIRNLGARV